MGERSFINVYSAERDVITHVYVEDGVRKVEKVRFKPFCGTDSREETGWSDVFGRPVKPRTFDSISDFNMWKRDNAGMIEVYGDMQPSYQFIAANYPKARGPVFLQKQGMNIFNLDIEVYCKRGFPKPEQAAHPINAITIQDMVRNKYTLFAYKNYKPKQKNVEFIHCDDEKDLLERFLKYLNDNPPDVFTGWNITSFDIPYIVHRLQSQISSNAHLRLSPVRKISVRKETDLNGTEVQRYGIVGVVDYDYKALYEKFTFNPRESYSLDYIAKFELGEEKLKFKEEHEDLAELYDQNPELFFDYNIKDVELVYNLDRTLRYIDLGFTITYMAKCLPEDVYGTVKIWDAFLYNELLALRKLCPPGRTNHKQEFPGGYVKDPVKGLHRWVKVYDVASSYPNQIRSYNMSTETIIDERMLPPELIAIREKFGTIEDCLDQERLAEAGIGDVLRKYDVAMAPNGHFFRTDIDGFIPEIVARVFQQRKDAKKEIKAIKAKIKEAPNDEIKHELEEELAAKDALQMALKIAMNSLYGAMSNVWFRYFDIRMASAITMGGQVCVRGVSDYVEKKFPMINNLASDTDSIFLNLEPIVKKRFGQQVPDKKTVTEFLLKFSDQMLQPCIDAFFTELSQNLNMKKLTIGMEPECISDVCLFIAKKKYAMKQMWVEGDWYLDKTKLKVKGIEIVRTSTPQFCRDKLKRAVELIFETESNEELIRFIGEVKDQFKELPFEKVAFPRGCNGLAKYATADKGVPIQVRAALLYNRLLKQMKIDDLYKPISEGDKIKFAYVRQPNPIGTDVIATFEKLPKEIADKIMVDYDLQFEKTFLSPLDKIFEAIDWHFVQKQTSLESFFS